MQKRIKKKDLLSKILQSVKNENSNLKINKKLVEVIFQNTFRVIKNIIINEKTYEKVGIDSFGIFKIKKLKARKIEVAKKPKMKKGYPTHKLSKSEKKIVHIPARISLSFTPSRKKQKIF